METIPRHIKRLLKKQLYQGKTILIFGARRVGKTHLIKQLTAEEGGKYYNGELHEVRALLSTTNTAKLREVIGNHRLIALDEVQSIPDIGLILKVIHDTFPEVQIIATGSSSFELNNATSGPLTGRSRTYHLYPLSYGEIRDAAGGVDAHARLEQIMRYGLYPEILGKPEAEKKEELMHITSNYLFKDALTQGQLRRPDLLLEILKLLAFQIGREVSLNEISNKINTSVHTVKHYLYLLEQSYIISSQRSLSRNLRNEIGKSMKYYFHDLGIRNAIINNFNQFSSRNDIGALWENFCVMERKKKNEADRRFVNTYFWRTYQQKEIDYIEEYEGQFHAYEFKWNDHATISPKEFALAYPDSTFETISQSDYFEFL